MLLAPMVARPADPDAVAKSVGDKVYCLCGCVTTLNHCPHPEAECSVQRDMHKLIRKDLAEGKSETKSTVDELQSPRTPKELPAAS